MKTHSVSFETNNNANDKETVEPSGLIEAKPETDNVCDMTAEELGNFLSDIVRKHRLKEK